MWVSTGKAGCLQAGKAGAGDGGQVWAEGRFGQHSRQPPAAAAAARYGRLTQQGDLMAPCLNHQGCRRDGAALTRKPGS
jgi:hypothetical protein